MGCVSLQFCGLCDEPIEADDDRGMVERVEQNGPRKGQVTRIAAHARCIAERFECPDCPGECETADLPVWLRPYNCRHVSDTQRRIRTLAFREHVDSYPPANVATADSAQRDLRPKETP